MPPFCAARPAARFAKAKAFYVIHGGASAVRSGVAQQRSYFMRTRVPFHRFMRALTPERERRHDVDAASATLPPPPQALRSATACYFADLTPSRPYAVYAPSPDAPR